MKRLPPLPKEVRKNFQPMYPFSSRRTPEDALSKHHTREWSDERKAALDPEAVSFYRGRAQAEGTDATRVRVLAVFEGRVIDKQEQTIRWRHDDDRQAKILEAEHDLAHQLKTGLVQEKQAAQERIDQRRFEALPSTRLARVREEIEQVETKLAELRAKESSILKEMDDDAA